MGENAKSAKMPAMALFSASPFKLKSLWIACFVVFFEEKNIHKAAQKLAISPQYLSKIIMQIEEALQLELSIQDGKQRYPNEQASALFAELYPVYRQLQALPQQLRTLEETRPKTVIRLWWEEPSLLSHTLKACCQYQQRNPHVLFDVQQALYDNRKAHYILHSEIDFFLASSLNQMQDYLHLFQARNMPFVIVSAPQAVQRWDAFAYLVIKYPSYVWDEVRYPRQIVLSCISETLLISYAKQNMGAVFIPLERVRPELERGQLAIVAEYPGKAFLAPCIFQNPRAPQHPDKEDFYLFWLDYLKRHGIIEN